MSVLLALTPVADFLTVCARCRVHDAVCRMPRAPLLALQWLPPCRERGECTALANPRLVSLETRSAAESRLKQGVGAQLAQGLL